MTAWSCTGTPASRQASRCKCVATRREIPDKGGYNKARCGIGTGYMHTVRTGQCTVLHAMHED